MRVSSVICISSPARRVSGRSGSGTTARSPTSRACRCPASGRSSAGSRRRRRTAAARQGLRQARRRLALLHRIERRHVDGEDRRVGLPVARLLHQHVELGQVAGLQPPRHAEDHVEDGVLVLGAQEVGRQVCRARSPPPGHADDRRQARVHVEVVGPARDLKIVVLAQLLKDHIQQLPRLETVKPGTLAISRAREQICAAVRPAMAASSSRRVGSWMRAFCRSIRPTMRSSAGVHRGVAVIGGDEVLEGDLLLVAQAWRAPNSRWPVGDLDRVRPSRGLRGVVDG
jgi:hypothetical protein